MDMMVFCSIYYDKSLPTFLFYILVSRSPVKS